MVRIDPSPLAPLCPVAVSPNPRASPVVYLWTRAQPALSCCLWLLLISPQTPAFVLSGPDLWSLCPTVTTFFSFVSILIQQLPPAPQMKTPSWSQAPQAPVGVPAPFLPHSPPLFPWFLVFQTCLTQFSSPTPLLFHPFPVENFPPPCHLLELIDQLNNYGI